jgi:non-homologous end joining protein Ku
LRQKKLGHMDIIYFLLPCESLGFAGIAKVTMHNHEYIVIIRARKNGLALHTMFYTNEIRAAKELGNTDKAEVKEQEDALAMQLTKSLAARSNQRNIMTPIKRVYRSYSLPISAR